MKLKLKDPWSAITHGVAGLLAIAGAAPLLLKAASGESTEAPLHIAALAVFILLVLFFAWTVFISYHRLDKEFFYISPESMFIIALLLTVIFCIVRPNPAVFCIVFCSEQCSQENKRYRQF